MNRYLLIWVVCFCFINLGYTQNIYFEKTKDTIPKRMKIKEMPKDTFIVVNDPDSLVYIVISKKKNPKDRITTYMQYSATKENKVLMFQKNQDVDSLNDGVYISTYPNGNIHTIKYIYKRKIHGCYYEFRENGMLWYFTSYKNGLLHGTELVFRNRKGRVWQISHYQDGYIHGIKRRFGGMCGNISSQCNFQYGKKQGYDYFFWHSAKIFSLSYFVNDVPTEISYYNRNGKTKKTCYYGEKGGAPLKTIYYNRKGEIKKEAPK